MSRIISVAASNDHNFNCIVEVNDDDNQAIKRTKLTPQVVCVSKKRNTVNKPKNGGRKSDCLELLTIHQSAMIDFECRFECTLESDGATFN